MRDSFARRINYLRLSVTDRCNLRCTYCMPAEGGPFCPAADLLTRQEIEILGQVAIRLGIQKIRVTGGEPLVRPDILDVLSDLGRLPGLRELAVTTNGLKLENIAQEMLDAGVAGANISIDSLNPHLYRSISRGGELDRCLRGINAALDVGLRTKLNVVVMAGINDQEAADFVAFAADRAIPVRFIEYMPTSGRRQDRALTLPSAQLLSALRKKFDLQPVTPSGEFPLAGPARNFRVVGSPVTVGFISAISDHFCADCNRIRITANGLARGCLFHETGRDLKPLLRAGDQPGLLRVLGQVVREKPAAHHLGEDEGPDAVAMSQVGG